MRPEKRKWGGSGVGDDGGNVIDRYISISASFVENPDVLASG